MIDNAIEPTPWPRKPIFARAWDWTLIGLACLAALCLFAIGWTLPGEDEDDDL